MVLLLKYNGLNVLKQYHVPGPCYVTDSQQQSVDHSLFFLFRGSSLNFKNLRYVAPEDKSH